MQFSRSKIYLLKNKMIGRYCFIFLVVIFGVAFAEEFDPIGALIKSVADVLTSANEKTRQYRPGTRPYPRPSSLSSTVSTALDTIVRNDELECVSKLLCEAAAGGSPGSSRQINIDKTSLAALLTYLNIGGGNSSPMLTFGKAALLGMSNRGDPYACVTSYPRCPRDQQRLLHYLNNHNGGFFRLFDMRPGGLTNGQGGYRPVHTNYPYRPDNNPYRPHNYGYRPNRQFKSRVPKKYDPSAEIYAKKYDHSSMSFSPEDFKEFSKSKTVVFPKDASTPESEPRILTKPSPSENNLVDQSFVFTNSFRDPKRLEYAKGYSGFFPGNIGTPVAEGMDRLPNLFYFPERENGKKQMKFPPFGIESGLLVFPS